MDQPELIIVGAGMAGLCMLSKARDLGLSAIILESGSGVGGAWFWNRYPGCRCDVDSVEYSFSFSDEVQNEWNWSEKMAAQEEIEEYLNFVTDRLDLRSDIRFNQFVDSAKFDGASGRWNISTKDGNKYSSQFLVMATGSLSVPFYPKLPNADTFKGDVYHTAEWPNSDPDFGSARVGVIGSGSSGVQLVQTIAPLSKSLTSFQRSPAYSMPAKNKPLSQEFMDEVKTHYKEIRERQRNSFDGLSRFEFPSEAKDAKKPSRKILELTPEQRKQEVEAFGINAIENYVDVFFNKDADLSARELYKDYLFRTVKDPKKAEALMPKDTPFRCKRGVRDTDYYSVFNLTNVDIVPLLDDPIETITATGIKTASKHHDLDILIYATGFDAVTGPLTRIDIRNSQGENLAELWDKNGLDTHLGLQIAGFPNLFTITGLGSPSVLSNLAYSIEFHVNWIGDCLDFMKNGNHKSIASSLESQKAWGDIVNNASDGRLLTSDSCKSWYLGSNIPGKERRFLVYLGGCDKYEKYCKDAASNNYHKFIVN